MTTEKVYRHKGVAKTVAQQLDRLQALLAAVQESNEEATTDALMQEVAAGLQAAGREVDLS